MSVRIFLGLWALLWLSVGTYFEWAHGTWEVVLYWGGGLWSGYKLREDDELDEQLGQVGGGGD